MSAQNQSSKTIAIDARMYGAGQTGIGNYIYHLMKYLFEIDKKNSYLVFLLPEEYDEFELPNERVKKIKVTAKWYGWKEQLIFPFEILKHKIDLIHFPHFNSPILYHWIVWIKSPLLRGGWGCVKKFRNIFQTHPYPSQEGSNAFSHFRETKTITTIHDLTPYYFPGHKMNSWLRRKSFRLVFSTAVKKSSRVIAVSEYTKRDMIKFFLNKLPEIPPAPFFKGGTVIDKIQVIYEGVDEQFQVIKNYDKIKAIKEKYKITKPFIFYTGVWRNHKNLVGLIKAFDLIVNKYRMNYQLVLGGKEDFYYPEVRQTWKKLNLGDKIIRTGFISQEELPLFYNAADVFVIPSFQEGFGLIGLEAMACGTPVISSNKTSLPEILGDAAVYFNPNNSEEMAEKIAQIIRDKDLKADLVQKGFRQIEKYDWKKMAGETLEMYEKKMGRK